MEVSIVAPGLIDHCAEDVIPFLRRAEKYAGGRYVAEDLIEMAKYDPATHLWIVYDEDIKIHGAAVTRLVEYPRCLGLWITAIAGDHMKDWLPEWDAKVTEFASKCGCSAIEAWARPGWSRFLSKHSIQTRHNMVVLEKRLDEWRRIKTGDPDDADGHPDQSA